MICAHILALQVPALQLGGTGHVTAGIDGNRGQLHAPLPLSALSFVKGYSPGMVPKFGRLVRRGRRANGIKAVQPQTPRRHPVAAGAAQDLAGGLSPLVARRLAGRLSNVHKAYVGLSSADSCDPCSPNAPGTLSEELTRSLFDATAFQWKPASDASLSSTSTAQPGTPEVQAPMLSHRRSTADSEPAGDSGGPKQGMNCCSFTACSVSCDCGDAHNTGSDYGASATMERGYSVDTTASEALSQDSDSDSNSDATDFGSHPSSRSNSLQSVHMLTESELHSAVHRRRRCRDCDGGLTRAYSGSSQPEDFASLVTSCTPRAAAAAGADVAGGRSVRGRPDLTPALSGSEVPIASPGVMARLTSDEVARLQGFADGAQVLFCCTEGHRALSWLPLCCRLAYVVGS